MEIRIQPHSIESEEAVIACCLLDEVVYDEVSQIVTFEDFYATRHQILFKAIGDMIATGSSVDTISLMEFLRTQGDEAEVGGYAGISGIQDRVETTTQAKAFARTVKEKSKLRTVIRLSRMSIEQAFEESESTEITSKLETDILAMNLDSADEFNIADTVERVREDAFGEDNNEYLPTGISSYDSSLKRQGFGPKQICICAARPGRGKTTWALNVGVRNARNGSGVGIFSFEMGDDELTWKMAGALSGVPTSYIDDNVANEDQKKRFSDALDQIAEFPIYIDEHSDTIEKLASKARYWKRKHNIKLIIVDYVQLMRGKGSKREEQVSDISRGMKRLAKTLKLPIIVLAQLNRESEREDRMPNLSDLRESGSLEQDADSVTFLYTLKEDINEPSKLRWVRPKQRAGQSFAQGEFLFRKSIGVIRDPDRG